MTTNAEWQSRKESAIARGQGNMAPIYVDHANNAEIWDVEGKRYIDFGAGIAVVNTGHGHPKVKAAVAEQLEKFSHTCVMVTPYDVSVRLAEKLNKLMPGDTPKKTIFLTTGAEAIENCVKIARAHTGRRGVIAFNGGFHGRTNLAMALTGKITPYKNQFGPFPAEIYHAPFPIDYHGITLDDALRGLNDLFKVDIAPSDVAAVILEPVQGEGGFYPASAEFQQALRRICDEHGIVYVADEIQTGFGRTGRYFCSEYAGVEPDLMATAKGIAGGLPISAVTGKSEIMDAPLPGGLGGTYGGSPIACAAALAVIEVIEEEELVERANVIGEHFIEHIVRLKEKYPQVIGDYRNCGAMVAMELVKDGDANQPDPELTKALVGAAARHGLILLSCGARGNVIRFLPALTIPEDLIGEGMDILTRCMSECT
ncbi:MAG: 4-aminobutyrate--2-oxoglutarate transaminase [Myxococcales bacterium]|nr:4-aminobutyrate--2-oxoglutarate transaminase [Myxococcales bacterium]HIK84074.1 4-aminobutyrate--2-oxoglutarate transaminase [Myxococcales bacterium]